MQMRPDRANRHPEHLGNLLIRPFFLMIKNQHSTLHLAQLVQLIFNAQPEFILGKLLLRVRAGMLQPVLPTRDLVRDRHCRLCVSLPSLPLILRNVYGNAIKISREQRLAAKAGQRTIQPQKDLLRQIFNVLPAAGQTHQRAEDHRLVVADNLLEVEVGRQGKVRPRTWLKVSRRMVKLCKWAVV